MNYSSSLQLTLLMLQQVLLLTLPFTYTNIVLPYSNTVHTVSYESKLLSVSLPRATHIHSTVSWIVNRNVSNFLLRSTSMVSSQTMFTCSLRSIH